MNDIDKATGLPALPDGQFWRVEKREPPTFDYLYPRDPKSTPWVVSLMRNQLVPTTVTKPKVHWWDPQPEPVTTWREGTAPMHEERVRLGDGQESSYRLTPQGIRAAAERIVDRIEFARAQSALLGDYPPNKLPTGGKKP